MQHAANIMQHATHSMNNAQHCSVQRTALCRIAPAQLDLELRDARGLRRGHTAQLRERLRAVGCTQPYTERTTAQRSMRVLLRCSAHRSGRMPRTTRRANREVPLPVLTPTSANTTTQPRRYAACARLAV
jgi:hypothetical protein